MIGPLVVALVAALVLGFTSVGLILRWGFTREYEQTLPPHIELLAQTLQTLSRDRTPERLAADLRELEGRTEARYELLSDGLPPGSEDLALRLGRNEPALRLGADQQPELYVPLSVGVLRVRPRVRIPLPDATTVGLAAVALLIIVFGVGFLFASLIVRRVQRLERVAQRLEQGDLGARAHDPVPDAIGSLARSFNSMAARVQGLLETQRQLLQAVAHELRTPVARARFGLELLADAPDEESRERRQLAIDEDLDEIDELVRELQFFNQMDAAAGLRREDCDLAEIVRGVAGKVQPLRPELAIVVASEGPCLASVDRRACARAVQNLLTNALRFARGRVVVRCATAPDGQARLVEVSDDGPGVPAEQRQRILEPFARADDARDKQSGGAGIGLAIVERALRAHGGSVEVGEAELGGARFTLRWPLS